MSRQRWIDDLFRRKLEQRSFPNDDRALDEMRAILDLRNAGAMETSRGGARWWWLTALLPAMLMALWTESERSTVTATNSPGITALVPNASFWEPSSVERFVAEPRGSDTTERFSLMAGSATVTNNRGSLPTDHARRSSNVPLTNALADHPVRAGNRAEAHVPVAVLPADMLRERAMHTAAGDSQRSDRQGAAGVVGSSEGLSNDRVSREHLDQMELRYSVAGITPERPVRSDIEPMRTRASGELHLFGAPLNVRSLGGDETRSAGRAGSLLGLEYRVRSKHLSLSTGVHYSAYAMQADQAEVTLNYVELPVLAGVELGCGRFGLLVQGGLSVDFLFNTNGEYALPDQRLGAGFPDDAFSTVNFSWLIRPQALYRVTERLSASAGPIWKTQLENVAERGGLEGARAASTGISIGLTWRLDRSTF